MCLSVRVHGHHATPRQTTPQSDSDSLVATHASSAPSMLPVKRIGSRHVNAILLDHWAKHYFIIIEHHSRRSCSIVRIVRRCQVICFTLLLLLLLLHVLDIQCEAPRRASRRPANYLIQALLSVALPIALHESCQLSHAALQIDIEEDGNLSVEHVRVFLIDFILQVKDKLLVNGI